MLTLTADVTSNLAALDLLNLGDAVDARSNQHLLLDGHVRLVALRDLGHSAAPCLIATDDETYTYNNRINRLSTIQEHIMIRRAVERGVPPERLAKALSVDVSQITKKVNLLDGICPEAIELFKDRQFSVELGRVIRKMKPTRQVERRVDDRGQQHDCGVCRGTAARDTKHVTC